VVLDGEPALTLSAVAAHRLGLRRGATVDAALWREASRIAEAEQAEAAGARMLAASARTRESLRRRLAARFSPEAVAYALDRLEAMGAIDDDAFARRWLQARGGARALGRPALVAGLVRAGIPAPEARRLVAEHLGDEQDGREAEAALALARVAAARYRGLPPDQAIRRLWAHLARRGFEASAIRGALRSVAREIGASSPEDPGEP
jgi:regulatory protein